MAVVRFQVVSRSKVVRFKCPCGKRFQRSVHVEQTINPWNVNADGQPKTRAEIWAELAVELAAKEPDPTHTCGQTGVRITPVVKSTKDGE